MARGQSGSRGRAKTVRRYYICGMYHHKEKTTCKLKSFNKEKIESAVVNSLLKEFALLSMDKALEEEILKYRNEKDRAKHFRLNSITQEIELTKMRINVLEKDSTIASQSPQIKEYFSETKKHLQKQFTYLYRKFVSVTTTIVTNGLPLLGFKNIDARKTAVPVITTSTAVQTFHKIFLENNSVASKFGGGEGSSLEC